MQTVIPFTYPAPKTYIETSFSNLVSRDIMRMGFMQEKLDKIYIEKEALLEKNTTFNTEYRYFLCGDAEEKYETLEKEHEILYKDCVFFGKVVLKQLRDEEIGYFMDTYFMTESKGPDPREIVKAVNKVFGTSSLFQFKYLANTMNCFLLEVSVNKDTEEERGHWMEIFGSLYHTLKPFMEKGVRFYGNYIYWFHSDITFEEWKIVPSLEKSKLEGCSKMYAHPTKTFIYQEAEIPRHFYTSLSLEPTLKVDSLVRKYGGYTETTDNGRVKQFFLTLQDAYNFLTEYVFK